MIYTVLFNLVSVQEKEKDLRCEDIAEYIQIHKKKVIGAKPYKI